jgi:hypothetical protein
VGGRCCSRPNPFGSAEELSKHDTNSGPLESEARLPSGKERNRKTSFPITLYVHPFCLWQLLTWCVLEAFIADTGIATQRDAVKEKEEGMSLKAKTRERVQPKMGKIDIDYQKLHDAFFKYQTKPSLTDFGEMYVFNL